MVLGVLRQQRDLENLRKTSADELFAQVFCKGLEVYERVPLSDSASLLLKFLASNGDSRGEWRCGKRIRWLSEARNAE